MRCKIPLASKILWVLGCDVMWKNIVSISTGSLGGRLGASISQVKVTIAAFVVDSYCYL